MDPLEELPDDPAPRNPFPDRRMMDEDDEEIGDKDICRVCRHTGEEGQQLYHPCLCTGSIKYVHQECLMQWLKYSKKEVCELCNHKFSFKPLYRPDMPERLPLSGQLSARSFCLIFACLEIVKGLLTGVFLILGRFLRLFLTYCLVATCWLGIVPLVACRVHRLVFSGLLSSFASMRFLNLFSLDNVAHDIVKGTVIVAVFFCTFISLVWLREQIMIGGPAHFLHLPDEPIEVQLEDVVEPPQEEQDEEQEADNNNPEEPLAPAANLQANNDVVEAAAGNENWGRDVERMVDDLTWQRLLGLDGSFVFIEHVFWVLILNVVFNVVFLYWPAQAGSMVFALLGISRKIPYFDTPISILVGYVAIILLTALTHSIARVLRFQTMYMVVGMAYLMLKVFLLVVVEVIFFPIICGWWLDICSLPVTGVTLDARLKSFRAYPSSSVFLHWLVGMIYVFYSASFILVLRELLRPGVLWFIRNLNDPEFNPVQEMIEQPVTRHLRRLVASTTLFFSIILLVVYFPIRLVRLLVPSLLPYSFSASADTPLGEFSLELILLQIVMPTILEYARVFSLLKKIVRTWCRVVGGWLKLDSYLLPANAQQRRRAAAQRPVVEPRADESDSDSDEDDGEAQPAEQNNAQAQQAVAARNAPAADDNNLAARHQALLMIREPYHFEAYERPDYFPLRIVALLCCLSLTAIAISFLFFTIPVSIGRLLLSFLATGNQPIHDLYTIAAGLYFCWLMAKAWMLSREWFQKGFNYVRSVFRSSALLVLRLIAGAIPLIFVIPFLLGLYFQLLVVGPLRVSINQTPLFFPWKEWAMGIVHFKIFCASVLMGPDWWLKTVFEQVYMDGIRGFRLGMLYFQMIFPIVNVLSFQIAFPYVVAKIFLQFLDLSREEEVAIVRYSYPSFLLLLGLVAFFYWQWSKLKSLAQKIRNDKYLIGTQLVNFYRENTGGAAAPAT
ncbi:E3 ubiquitin-protein ligase MARCH6 [Aphelenchoides avenae]|nr:E3 ubiquitin-protein ligase MARCH6 [Aphelenchus avenae]